MFHAIKSFFTRTKSRLFSFNNEPFSKFSILFIILLDIFLFITILSGIGSETEMSPKIDIKYPSECQKHFTVEHSSSEYKDFFIPTQLSYSKHKSLPIHEDRRTAPLCVELYEKVAVIVNSETFTSNKKLQNNLKRDNQKVLLKIDNIEKRYNTALFEKISLSKDSNYKAIKKTYYELLEKEKNIENELKGIKQLSSYEGYKAYEDFVTQNRVKAQEELASYKLWKPFISFLYLLKFTLPLLILSFLLYRFTTRVKVQEELASYKLWKPFISFLYLLKFTLPLLILSFLLYRFTTRVKVVESIPTKIVALISSHIIFIVLVPIFINIMYLVYHILPHEYLASLFELLYQFGFVFLGYYFLMFLTIVVLGTIIFFIQRGVAKKEQLRKEIKEKTLHIDAYNQSICPNCKNRVDYSKNYCGYCKEMLFRECSSCQNKTVKYIEYCMECGEKEL